MPVEIEKHQDDRLLKGVASGTLHRADSRHFEPDELAEAETRVREEAGTQQE